MTGFLYRLAERAMGTAQPLRKVSSTLFAPTLTEEVSRPVDTMAAATVEVAPSLPVQTIAEPDQPGRNRAQTVSMKSAQRREAATTGGEAALDHAVTAHSQAVLENPTVLQKPGQTYISQPAGTRPPILVPSVPGAGQSPAAETTTQSGWPVQALLKMDAKPPEPLRPLPTLSADIEPLLPLAPPPRQPFRGTASASTGNRGSLPAGMIEETTEVHVSIGRIEVTAVHEPAPSKPAAPSRNAPMSLDDYLAKRHGGRS